MRAQHAAPAADRLAVFGDRHPAPLAPVERRARLDQYPRRCRIVESIAGRDLLPERGPASPRCSGGLGLAAGRLAITVSLGLGAVGFLAIVRSKISERQCITQFQRKKCTGAVAAFGARQTATAPPRYKTIRFHQLHAQRPARGVDAELGLPRLAVSLGLALGLVAVVAEALQRAVPELVIVAAVLLDVVGDLGRDDPAVALQARHSGSAASCAAARRRQRCWL